MNLLNYLSNEGILMSDMERLYKYSKYQDYKNSTVAKIFGNEEIVNKELVVNYKFNEHGFRTKSWEDNKEECYVAFGCSNTLGVGTPEHLRWSNILEETLAKPIFNLGIGHGSADTVTRLAKGWLHEIKPTKVFVLWPPQSRWEVATKNRILTVSATQPREQHFPEDLAKLHYVSMDEALTEEQFDEAAGEKDACYHKVKSRYKVWPSAYASGALVKCRKVGAKNWGNKSKKK